MRRDEDEDEEFIATPKNLSAMVGQELYEGPFGSLGWGKRSWFPSFFSNAFHGDLPKDHQGRGVFSPNSSQQNGNFGHPN